jgi:hypothetical protein
MCIYLDDTLIMEAAQISETSVDIWRPNAVTPHSRPTGYLSGSTTRMSRGVLPLGRVGEGKCRLHFKVQKEAASIRGESYLPISTMSQH